MGERANASLGSALANLCRSGRVEVHEDGELLAELSPFQFEVRTEGRHTLLHLWSQERNLVRSVLGIAERGEGSLRLEVQKFGRSKPGRLEFVVPERARPDARLKRERFRARFRQLLAESFPDEKTESLSSTADLARSFSGSYTRGLMRRGARAWAVMGVSAQEDAATVDAILSYGLIWLDWQRGHARRTAVAGLRLFVPAGSATVTVHRLRALSAHAPVEIYEVEESAWRAQRLDPQDIGNLATWLTPRRDVDETLHAAREVLDRVRTFAPEAIDALVAPGTREVALRFRGLEFARWRGSRLLFGLPDQQRRPLEPGNWKPLKQLLKGLAAHRNPQATNTHHPLYRGQAERWLETLILMDPTRLDAQLDPRYLYSQVPAFSAGDRGVIDLLGATHDGRLAVLELKASEDIHLALQAVDYWLRVRWHQQQGDFPRYGYFGGLELQAKAPRLYLVAPGFRFHPATDVILRYLTDEIEVVRVGLNESWRQGPQVIFRS